MQIRDLTGSNRCGINSVPHFKLKSRPGLGPGWSEDDPVPGGSGALSRGEWEPREMSQRELYLTGREGSGRLPDRVK